jgi:aromatic-L-amino-acid decarboxylase
VCLRYRPEGIDDEQELNSLNERLLSALNDTDKVYMTHTKLAGAYTIRFMIGQTTVEQRHVEAGWDLLAETARALR